jgi:hypothetical protein
MPLTCRLGKYRICKGTPLRAYIRRESLPFLPPLPGPLIFTLECIDREAANIPPAPSTIENIGLDAEGVARIELPTDTLIPGAYQVVLSVSGKDHLQVPEPVWILSREQFLQLASEEASEEFLPAPPLERIEELRSFVEDIIRERLRVPMSDSRTGSNFISMRASSSEGLLERPISSGPIQWTTEAMVDEVNYIAVGGAKAMRFQIELTRDAFGLRFQATLDEPLSPRLFKSLRDREINELELLNSKGDLKDFRVRIQIAPLSPQIELMVQQSVEAHPVLKIGASRDARPVPRARKAEGAS